MADQSSHDDTLKEIEELLNDKNFCQMFERRNDETTKSNANESTMSTTTPSDPLNTAFMNDTNNVNESSPIISLSEPQSKSFATTATAAGTAPMFLGQTTNETALILHGLVNTITTQEQVVMDFRTLRPTMVSTSTMPKTPVKMLSIGTMPKTPSPTILPTVPAIDTIDLCSPTTSTIDLCSPTTIETIDLLSPDTPPESMSSTHTPTPQMAPP